MESIRVLASVFKLRIAVSITLCTLAGIAMTPGVSLGASQIAVLALAVMLSSASAGALNQYVERDLDARMGRTRRRPFVTGRYSAGWHWPLAIAALLLVAVWMAAAATNAMAALHVFLGAVTYGIVYTLWLKRRTSLNIVIGGLAGSFAVLAGAAAVDPSIPPAPLTLAVMLFLWTPPHFWSLAFMYKEDYAQAGVPMLPVVTTPSTCAWIVLAHTVALVAVSLLPVAFGAGWIYFGAAVIGGALFLNASVAFARRPNKKTARRNFLASLMQLTIVLLGAMVDGWLAMS